MTAVMMNSDDALHLLYTTLAEARKLIDDPSTAADAAGPYHDVFSACLAFPNRATPAAGGGGHANDITKTATATGVNALRITLRKLDSRQLDSGKGCRQQEEEVDVECMTIFQMRKSLRRLGLPTVGLKPVLARRLIAAKAAHSIPDKKEIDSIASLSTVPAADDAKNDHAEGIVNYSEDRCHTDGHEQPNSTCDTSFASSSVKEEQGQTTVSAAFSKVANATGGAGGGSDSGSGSIRNVRKLSDDDLDKMIAKARELSKSRSASPDPRPSPKLPENAEEKEQRLKKEMDERLHAEMNKAPSPKSIIVASSYSLTLSDETSTSTTSSSSSPSLSGDGSTSEPTATTKERKHSPPALSPRPGVASSSASRALPAPPEKQFTLTALANEPSPTPTTAPPPPPPPANAAASSGTSTRSGIAIEKPLISVGSGGGGGGGGGGSSGSNPYANVRLRPASQRTLVTNKQPTATALTGSGGNGGGSNHATAKSVSDISSINQGFASAKKNFSGKQFSHTMTSSSSINGGGGVTPYGPFSRTLKGAAPPEIVVASGPTVPPPPPAPPTAAPSMKTMSPAKQIVRQELERQASDKATRAAQLERQASDKSTHAGQLERQASDKSTRAGKILKPTININDSGSSSNSISGGGGDTPQVDIDKINQKREMIKARLDQRREESVTSVTLASTPKAGTVSQLTSFYGSNNKLHDANEASTAVGGQGKQGIAPPPPPPTPTPGARGPENTGGKAAGGVAGGKKEEERESYDEYNVDEGGVKEDDERSGGGGGGGRGASGENSENEGATTATSSSISTSSPKKPPQQPQPPSSPPPNTSTESTTTTTAAAAGSPNKIPKWARSNILAKTLDEQFGGARPRNPDTIFPPFHTCDLSAIFDNTKKKRYNTRTSTGNWGMSGNGKTFDGLTVAEKLAYEKSMRYIQEG